MAAQKLKTWYYNYSRCSAGSASKTSIVVVCLHVVVEKHKSIVIIIVTESIGVLECEQNVSNDTVSKLWIFWLHCKEGHERHA